MFHHILGAQRAMPLVGFLVTSNTRKPLRELLADEIGRCEYGS